MVTINSDGKKRKNSSRRNYKTTHPKYTIKVREKRLFTCPDCGHTGLSALLIPRCKCTKKIYDLSSIRELPK